MLIFLMQAHSYKLRRSETTSFKMYGGMCKMSSKAFKFKVYYSMYKFEEILLVGSWRLFKQRHAYKICHHKATRRTPTYSINTWPWKFFINCFTEDKNLSNKIILFIMLFRQLSFLFHSSLAQWHLKTQKKRSMLWQHAELDGTTSALNYSRLQILTLNVPEEVPTISSTRWRWSFSWKFFPHQALELRLQEPKRPNDILPR